MKLITTLVLTAAALAAGTASAATYSSDAERRDQNRAEALDHWRASNDGKMSMRESTARGDRSTSARPTLRERTHRSAQAVRNFSHRQAEKARNFSDRQNRRAGTEGKAINTSPEGGGK